MSQTQIDQWFSLLNLVPVGASLSDAIAHKPFPP